MKIGLLILTVAICITGCANKQVFKETDYPLIEEQDTPFIFKQAYQYEGAVVTQKTMPVKSDFVVIAESEQYVFWKPIGAPASVVEAPKHVSSDIVNNVVDKSNDEKEVVLSQAENDNPKIEECVKILCADGSHCGNIKKCGSTPCEEAYSDQYQCVGEDCSAFSVDYVSTAKANPNCQKHPHLFECAKMMSCKEKI